jgi:hypothetical protein
MDLFCIWTTPQVWKIPAEGGEAVQVTRKGGHIAFESLEGKFVYYAKPTSGGSVWRVPVNGGEEISVLESPTIPADWWRIVNEGIFFVDLQQTPKRRHKWFVKFFSFDTRRVTQIAPLEKEPSYICFAVSTDPR